MLLLAGLGALALSLPIGGGDRRPAGHRRHLLPADDQGLPARRRLLHRRQGQPGRAAGADRRRGAADRLRADGRGQHRGRRGRARLGVARRCSGYRVLLGLGFIAPGDARSTCAASASRAASSPCRPISSWSASSAMLGDRPGAQRDRRVRAAATGRPAASSARRPAALGLFLILRPSAPAAPR